MARRLYSLFFYLCLPIIFVRLYGRSRRMPLYRKRWGERLGIVKNPPQPQGVWIHAVSVGETIAAAPLVKRLQADYPDLPITITTMTPTGSAQVRKYFSDSVFHVYIPYDLPGAVRRLLKALQPRLLVVMETELWPNLVDQCQRRNIPIMIANARLSERSAAGYARLDSLTRPMLQQLSLVISQTEQDSQRLQKLGVDAQRLLVGGNIKFDISVTEQAKTEARSVRKAWGIDGENRRKVFIAASTHEGEEPIVLAAFQRLLQTHPTLLLLMVPRHPERFDEVVQLSNDLGLNTLRRSNQQPCTAQTQVVVGDTMGELMTLYGVADVAFVGGSLVETGGHNLLEAAVWRLPIISGTHLFNFAEVDQLMTEAGALVKVENEQQLAVSVEQLLTDIAHAHSMGQAAYRVVEQNRGSLDRLYQQIRRFL